MTEFLNRAIDVSKIKMRWQEPYSSEAFNRGMTVHAPGIYRGGSAGAQAVPDKTFIIGPNGDGTGVHSDSLFVNWDQGNGFSAIVLDTETITVDMSSRFSGSGGAMPADETWWVWQELSYSTGVATTASYRVTDTAPPSGANIIAKINTKEDDERIQEANFDRSVRSLPLPDKREGGVYVSGDTCFGVLSGEEAWNIPGIDQKRAMNSAAETPNASNPFVTKKETLDIYFGEPSFVQATISSGDGIQLTGYYYVGRGVKADSYFSFRDKDDNSIPLENANGELIAVASIAQDGDSGVLVPSSHADANGFYENPFIKWTPSITGDIGVNCFKRVQLSSFDQSPALALPEAGKDNIVHAARVNNRSITDTPDSLSKNTIESQMSTLLGYVNNRARKGEDETITGEWTIDAPVELSYANGRIETSSPYGSMKEVLRCNNESSALGGARLYYWDLGSEMLMIFNAEWNTSISKWVPIADNEYSYALGVSYHGIRQYYIDKANPKHSSTTGWTHTEWRTITRSLMPFGAGTQMYLRDNMDGQVWDRMPLSFSGTNFSSGSRKVKLTQSVTWNKYLNDISGGSDITFHKDTSSTWMGDPTVISVDRYGAVIDVEDSVVVASDSVEYWRGYLMISVFS